MKTIKLLLVTIAALGYLSLEARYETKSFETQEEATCHAEGLNKRHRDSRSKKGLEASRNYVVEQADGKYVVRFKRIK